MRKKGGRRHRDTGGQSLSSFGEGAISRKNEIFR